MRLRKGLLALLAIVSLPAAAAGAQFFERGESPGLVVSAGDEGRDLSHLRVRDVDARSVSFATGEGGPPLTVVTFFSSSC